MNTPEPRLIVPDTKRRDTFIAIAIGAVVLLFVGLGIVTMSKPHPSANTLTGVVVAKQFTPMKEQQVSFSGRKLEGTRQIDGEYVLKVRVDQENRTYDVPVEKPIYESKKEGDKLEFVRPPSEQR